MTDDDGGLRGWFTPQLVGLHLLLVAAVGVCLWFGSWQLGVYDGRQADEKAVAAEVAAVPLDTLWGPHDAFDPALEHRTVTIDGEWGAADEQLWVTDRRQGDASGVWLVAPLLTAPDTGILVVRGWAPEVTDVPDLPTGSVTVEAVLQPNQGGGPPWDPDTRTIGAVRIPALTNELPYELYSGFAITQDAVPTGFEPPAVPDPDVSWTVGLKNLAYALQWWVFGAFAVFMWWRMVADQRQGRVDSLTA